MEIGTYDHVFEPRRVHDESHLDYGRLAIVVRLISLANTRDDIMEAFHLGGLTKEILGNQYPLFPPSLGRRPLGKILNDYTSDSLMMIDWTLVAWPQEQREPTVAQGDGAVDVPDTSSGTPEPVEPPFVEDPPLNFLSPFRDRKEIKFGFAEDDLVTGGGFAPPAPSASVECTTEVKEKVPPDIGQVALKAKPTVAYATAVSKESGADQCGPVGGVSTQPTACRPACDPERSGKPKPPRPPDLRHPGA